MCAKLTASAAGLPGATPLQLAKGIESTSSMGLTSSFDVAGLAKTMSRSSLILSESPRRSFRSSMTRLRRQRRVSKVLS